MKTGENYESALLVVGSVIRDWNPYSLLDGEAPDDEFDGEIAQLVTHIHRISTPADAAQAISIVFSQAFGGETFAPSPLVSYYLLGFPRQGFSGSPNYSIKGKLSRFACQLPLSQALGQLP